MLRFPIPAAGINGTALADEITAAGYSDVKVSLVGDEVHVDCDGLAPVFPSDDERLDVDDAEIPALIDAAQRAGDAANEKIRALVAPVVARHVPPQPAPPVRDRRAEIIDAATDWRSAMRTLADEGLLGGT